MSRYFAALLFAAYSYAQQGVSSASLHGKIVDITDAPFANLEVHLRDLARNQTQTVKTNSVGFYNFVSLIPGDYELTTQALGFKPVSRRVTLSIGQSPDLSIQLDIGKEFIYEVVTHDLPVLETDRTSSAHLIYHEEVDALPLNGRNYLDLAILSPGVSRTNTGAPQAFAETSAVPGTGVSFSSQRNLNNNFVLDGLSLNDDAAGLAGTFLSQEVVQEFQTVHSGGTAEFGRASAGTINVSSKSGTNVFHGRAYGFLRNQRFDARNALFTRKDPLTQTQYGASLGGPIRHDRTFFFSNFEQTRRNAASTVTIAPANVAVINAVLNSTPGYNGPRVTTGEYSTGWDLTSYFAHIDHNFNSNNRATVRYILYDIASPNARNAGGLSDISRGTRLDNRDQNIAANWTSLLSAITVNELRAQFTRSHLSAPGNDIIGPSVSIAGVANFGASTTSPVGRDNDLIEVNDSLALVRGHHTIRTGAGFLDNRLNINFPGSQVAAVYTFSSLATFQAGRYQTVQQAFGDPNQFQSNPNLGLFFQDEWRALPKLTLQLGARYDVQWLPSPIHTDTNNIAPRFGLAWSPGKYTVIRAHYGLYYDRIPLRATSNALQRDGSKYRVALLSFGQTGAPAFPFQATAFPDGQYINITTIDPRIQNSYSHQAGMEIEHRIGGLALTAGYQWLRDLHLILSRNVNVPTLTAAQATALGVPNLGRPDSRYGNVSRYEGSGDSYYNGLQVSAQYYFVRGSTIRVSYTLSKAIDDFGNAFFNSPQNNFNLRDDRGLSDNDQRHRLTVSSTLQSWGRNPFVRDWQLSPIFIYTSALPYNVLLGSDRNFDTSTNDRPIGIGRNTGRGFNYASLDFRLSRTFRLHEHLTIQAIAEAFNSLNHTNRTVPNNVITSPAFGQATAVFDPRQLQFGARLNF